jgi:hypothetical protein
MYCLQLRLARTHANNGICYLLVIGVTLAFESDMVEPSKKKAKQLDLNQVVSLRSKLPFMSQSALAAILKIAKTERLPTGAALRKDIRKARDDHVKVQTPYGAVHQPLDVGAGITIECQHPMAMLHQVCQRSGRFSDLMSRTIRDAQPSPAKPLSIIIYSDGVSPGNQLSYSNARKTWAWYWSIYEFDTALANEDAWFELALVRNAVAKKIPGGMSGLLRCLLSLFFSDSHSFSTSGVNVQLADGSFVLVFGALKIVLADEDALHAMFGCKGASGLKCCLLCTNCYNAQNGRDILRRDPTHTAVDHTCADISKLQFATTEVITAIVTRLETCHATLGVGKFNELQLRLGWNYNPHGVMFNPISRAICDPSKTACFDTTHVLFVNGIFNNHAGLMLRAFRELKVAPRSIANYCSIWTWPKSISSAISPEKVFDDSRLKSSLEKGELKCTASEGMSLLPVLAHFCESLLTHANLTVRRHAQCFLYLALVVGCIFRAPRRLMIGAVLEARCKTYMESFLDVYGPDWMTPKFHFLLHFSLYPWTRLPNCFVHERKHKWIKRIANNICNVWSEWDQSVLREVTSLHVERLAAATTAEFAIDAGLVDGKAPSKKLMAALQAHIADLPAECFKTSLRARCNKFEIVSKGDVVMIGHGTPPILGEVLLHAAVSVGVTSEVVTLVSESHVTATSKRSWKCTRSDKSTLFCTSDIVCALMWAGDAIITVLQPLHATRNADL